MMPSRFSVQSLLRQLRQLFRASKFSLFCAPPRRRLPSLATANTGPGRDDTSVASTDTP